MDAGIFVLLLLLAVVALLVFNLVRVASLARDVSRIDGGLGELRTVVVTNANVTRDLASSSVSGNDDDVSVGDLELLMSNPMVQKILETK